MTVSHRALLLSGLLLAMITPLSASAQDVPHPPVDDAPDAPAEPPAPPRVDAPVEDERPWGLYQTAFELCAAGEREACEQTLRGIVTTYPDHRAAVLATSTLEGLAKSQPMPQPPTRLIPNKPFARRGSNGERYTSLARAELISAQTLHGIVLGGELCVALDCSDARVVVATMMATGGVGLAASFYATQEGVTPGHTVALNSGTVWGAVNAGMLASLSDDGSSKQFALSLMGGQLVGLGLGQLYYMGAKPLAGQVSLANSGGIWTLVGFGLLQGAANLDLDSDQFTTGMVVAMDAGLLAGGALAHFYPMSRSRATLLDTGGLAGLLSGMGLYVLIANDGGDQGFFTAALAGTVLGIGTAAYLTRDWDSDDEDVQSRLLPTVSLVPGDSLYTARGERQGGWGLSASWVW
jgi:hypothetical protein